MLSRRLTVTAVALLGVFNSSLMAQASVGLSPAGSRGPEVLSVPVQLLVLLTSLTVLPSVIMTMTPFLRISVVLHFLRQAIGTQSMPSNQVLLGMALYLTAVAVQPVATQIYRDAWLPLEQNRVSITQALEIAEKPARAYLLRFTREPEVRLFVELSKIPQPRGPEELPLRIVIPAYVLSELKASFQIGAVLFLPFLIIDLVVASVTLSIGMVQLPPVMVSAPFKILLFVLVDGWTLVIGSLMKGLMSP